MESFNYRSYPQEIVFGAGALGRLREAVERAGWQRVLLVTGPALRENGHAAEVEAALGGCRTATFDRVEPHVQDAQVEEVALLVMEQRAQAVIGLGGGSPIGMAKAVSWKLEEQRGPVRPATFTTQPEVPAAAIPTTYAGSEMTAVVGVTQSREDPPRKATLSDPRIAPRLVVYDPRLTLDLPPGLTASTGMNALAHCVEALYSVTRNPLSSAAAGSAIGRIMKALPVCYAHGEDEEARGEMLLGAYLAGLALSNVKMGLHHGFCHVLGGSFGVPHGIANAIVLPYAVRFNASACAPQLIEAAGSMGIPTIGRSPSSVIEEMIERIFDLTGRMNLPQRLRDAGIKEQDIPRLARLAFENGTIHNNPRPVKLVEEMEEFVRGAR